MIEVENIHKSFKSIKALQQINLSVEQGSLFGLIGPDGAGKTTLFRILATLMLPDKGKAWVTGWDVVTQYRKIRNELGYMPGRFSLYQDLSVEENLQFFATTFGTTISDNYELIRDIYGQIEPFKDRKAGNLSGGMKQKLALSCALIHRPKVLILDEPTTGVDPVSRKEFWEMLKKLKPYGITILVSTPYMDEAGLCEKVALIQKGEIMAVNSPKQLEDEFSKPLFEISSDTNMLSLINDLNDYSNSNSVFAFGDTVHYTDNQQNETQIKKKLKEYLEAKGHHQISVRKISANIEDRFMELMS